MNAIDAIDLEIYWSRLIAIVDEAGAALKRTAFSTVVRESNDFACVLLDADGQLLAQSSISVPGFIGTAPLSLERMLEECPTAELRPGDVLFTNDPWIGTGHLPDATMAAPLFSGDALIGFVVAVAHLSDVGGRQWSADSNEVFEEGVRIPVLKLMDKGVMNKMLLRILETNVRVPDRVLGDVHAMLSAIHVCEQRLQEFLRDYAQPDLSAVSEAIYKVSGDAALREVRRLPAGTYVGEVEADGWDAPIKIRASITISNDGIAVDYAGSSPQSQFGINESYNHTFAYTVYPLKCLLCPEIPNNAGFTRLFRVNAPEGTIVNARPPAAVGARQLVGHLLQAAVFAALSGVMPDRVQADSGTPLWTLVLRGLSDDDGRTFSTVLFFNGGMGAMQSRDGYACTSFPGNISNTPVEVTETIAPILFSCKRLAIGSGGKGARNGGDGQVVAFQSRWPGVIRASLLTERVIKPANGLKGGGPGAVGAVRKNGQDVQQPKGVVNIYPGDVLELTLPGGGGFGSQ